jgi:hypothetical protein
MSSNGIADTHQQTDGSDVPEVLSRFLGGTVVSKFRRLEQRHEKNAARKPDGILGTLFI